MPGGEGGARRGKARRPYPGNLYRIGPILWVEPVEEIDLFMVLNTFPGIKDLKELSALIFYTGVDL